MTKQDIFIGEFKGVMMILLYFIGFITHLSAYFLFFGGFLLLGPLVGWLGYFIMKIGGELPDSKYERWKWERDYLEPKGQPK